MIFLSQHPLVARVYAFALGMKRGLESRDGADWPARIADILAQVPVYRSRLEEQFCAAEAYAERLELRLAEQQEAYEALEAIETYFAGISADIRRVERARLAAEPSHLEALVKFAERAYRRPLSSAERDELLMPYLKRGVQRGDICLCVTRNGESQALTLLVAQDGVEFPALQLLEPQDTYLQSGAFEPELMLDVLDKHGGRRFVESMGVH